MSVSSTPISFPVKADTPLISQYSLTFLKILSSSQSISGPANLLERDLLINFIGYMLITLGLVFIIKDYSYFIVSFILTIFEVLLVIISTFMILYKSEKRGVHDYITSTQVIDVEG